MENYIIIGVIALITLVAISTTVKRAGRKGCCSSGGDYKPKKKKLKNVLYQKTFKVEGMHCEHCKNRVEEVVNNIKGIAGKVNLKKGELCVSYAEAIDDELIKAHIEKAGYKVTGLEGK